MKVAIVHPGAMGYLIGATCAAEVFWSSAGRSENSRRRAAEGGIIDLGTMEALVDAVDVVVSVCPPHAAIAVADQVAGCGFRGIYVDANAISPQLAVEVGSRFARFVDGGIVGPPPRRAGTTRFYLSGEEARAVAPLWDAAALDVRVLDGPPGTASAVKMAYAAWTKGSSALLLAVRGYAEAMGVADELTAEWQLSIPDLPGRVERTAGRTGPKAWRFVGEMAQIVEAMAAAGLPTGFHEAAGEVYRRLADLKEAAAPSLDDVIQRLVGDDEGAR